MDGVSYQLYSSRKVTPLSATLRMLAELGYTQVEGYGGLYPDRAPPTALATALAEAGLRMTSGHVNLDSVLADPGAVIALAQTLGMRAVFIPAIAAEARPVDATGWAALGAALNEAGKPLRDAGLVFGWHNHAFEFADLGAGDLPLGLLLDAAPELALELDLAWVHVAGHDPAVWVARYADRLFAAHVKDVAPAGTAPDEDGWADVGHGVMDWPALMAGLRQTSAEVFVVEHDNPTDAHRFASRSLAALREM